MRIMPTLFSAKDSAMDSQAFHQMKAISTEQCIKLVMEVMGCLKAPMDSGPREERDINVNKKIKFKRHPTMRYSCRVLKQGRGNEKCQGQTT